MSAFFKLPPECLLLITGHFDTFKDLNAFARTAKFLRPLINSQLCRRLATTWMGTHVLKWGCQKGFLQTVQYCLDAGLDANHQGACCCDNTPLLEALFAYSRADAKQPEFQVTETQGRYHAVIELLLSSGADVNCKSVSGIAPLQLAIMLPNKKVAELLGGRGADMTMMDPSGKIPLHLAACNKSFWPLRFFVNKGVDVNAVEKVTRDTPLHLAVWRLDEKATAELLGLGANVNAVNWLGETPLHRAVSSPWRSDTSAVIQLLVDNGADMEAIGCDSRTALQRAVGNSASSTTIKCLVKNGAAKSQDAQGLSERARCTSPAEPWPRRSKRIAENFA